MTQEIAGWRLSHRLGFGAVGEVWAAQSEAGEQAAIKLLRGDEEEALLSEARVAAQLRHPHVVHVYDVGRAERGLYLVMELARYGALSSVCGRLEWSACGALLEQVLRGLGEVHAAGVLHLDLKPGNVLLTRRGQDVRALLSDLGLMGMTRLGGTPQYMAPEQRAGARHRLGPWTDLYALGVMARELVTGARDGALDARWSWLGGWLGRLCAEQERERYPSAAHALEGLRRCAPAWQARVDAAQLEQVLAASDVEVSSSALGSTRGGSALSAWSAAPAMSSAPAERAPIDAPAWPAAWAEGAEAEAVVRAGLGEGLAQLRALPLVGLGRERDALWALLARGDRGPVGVVLEGDEEASEALARWSKVKAHALVGWQSVEIEARRGEAASALLARLITALVSPHGEAPRGELVGQLMAWMAAGGVEGSRAEAMAVEAAGLLREAARGEGAMRPTQERVGQVARLLGAMSAGRPLLWVVCGGSCTPLVAQLCEAWMSQPEARGAVVWAPGASGWIAPKLEGEGQRVAVAAPAAHEIARLVRGVVGVSREVAELLALRAGGSPRFALEVLKEWVRRGELVAGPTGLGLSAMEEVKLPQTLSELWAGRLAELGPTRGLWGLAAVEGGGELALGERICAELGEPWPREAWGQMARLGWGALDARGWRVEHELCRRALLAQASEAGELGRVYAAAARGLEACEPARRLEIARCWVGAGQAEQAARALSPLLAEGFDAGSAYGLLEVLEGVGEGQGALEALRGRAWYAVGDNARAEAALGRVAQEAEQATPALRVAVDELRVLLALSRGKPQEAAHVMEGLLGLREALVGDEALWGRALVAAGRCAIHLGEPARAVAMLEEALGAREALPGQLAAMAQLLVGVAYAELGALDEAQGALEACTPLIREMGATTLLVSAVNTLGDVAIKRERWVEAERWLSEGIMLCQERYPLACYPRGNMGWVKIRQGLAQEALEVLERGLEGAGPGVRHRPWFLLASLRPCALAMVGDEGGWDEALALWREGSAAVEIAHEEGAQAFEIAARVWASRGDSEREAQAQQAQALLRERLARG